MADEKKAFVPKSFDETIKEMKSTQGNIVHENVRVIGITPTTTEDGRDIVCITVDKYINAYLPNTTEEGIIVYKEGKDNKFTIGLGNFIVAMKYNGEELSSIADKFKAAPKTLNLILNGCTIDLVQIPVKGKTKYLQPFKNVETYTEVKNDTYYNYVTKVVPTEEAKSLRTETVKSVANLFATL